MKLITIFPKDSEALFNVHSERTFGGADVQMYFITKELEKYSDIEVSSFIVNYEKIDFPESAHFHLIKTYSEQDNVLKKFLLYHRMIRRIKPDAIIQRGLTLFSCFLSLYCKVFSIKFIFMFAHDIESHGRYQKNHKVCILFPLLIKCSHRLIVQNEYEYTKLKKSGGMHKTRILKKGLDLSIIKKAQVATLYDCIWIARCEQWKNPDIFIELAKANRELRFIMVCSKVKGKEDYFDTIENFASTVNNLLFINFLDYKSIYELLSQTKVFCITSSMEGDWPMTVLEAAATGLPILSYQLEYGNLLSNYNGGYFCNGDFNRMSEYLKALTFDSNHYKEKSDGALRYIHENHDIATNVKRLVEFIR